MSTKSIYIAGPMSGISEWNYPAFFAAEDLLKAQGWAVTNPARKDEEMGYGDSETKATGDTALSIAKGLFDYKAAYLWDMEQVIYGDGIYMLEGWENSVGAKGELAAALFCQKQNPDYQIIFQTEGEGSGVKYRKAA